MKYLFVLLFVLIYILFGMELGYTDLSPFHTHLTYMFQHSGVVHLILNSMAFIAIFHSLQKFVKRRIIIPSMVLCGFAASFLSEHEIPTVGASSMVYAMIGMYIGVTLISRNIKIADIRKYLLFILCVGIGLLVSALKQNSNFLVHVYSLVFGVILSVPVAVKKG